MMKRVCLIGGGTSNLFCALELSKHEFLIDIYESNNKLARKLLASGNGRCNISNTNLNIDKYNNPSFAKNILMSFNDIKNYLNSIGLYLSNPDSDGRVYPYSYHSFIVLNAITNNFNKNVHIYLDTIIRDIKKENNYYIVNNHKYDYVVVGIGSNADLKIKLNPLENSIVDLGLKYTNRFPSICPLKVKENINALEGIRQKCSISLFINNSKITTKSGELLFKKDEVSGIVIFELSTLLARYKRDHKIDKCFITIDLINKEIEDKLKINPSIDGLFLPNLCKELRRDVHDVNELIYKLHNYKLNIDLNNDSDIYQVVCGGIDVNCLTSCLESIKNKNLYFGGEIIDVDGECGGYNLSFAISSGLVIADSIINK